MTSSAPEPFDVVVVGAGPAGVVAALRAGRLGARTALITRDQFGGMAANDGPVPVRTLAQAARLIREARQLSRYGIAGGEPSLDYPRLLARVREVTAAVREQTLLRDDLDRAGVRIYEQAGPARFADAHTVESDNAPRRRGQLEAGNRHVTGRAMVVHEAVRQGLVAATNAVLGANTVLPTQVSPSGSFTDPEYASVGLTETAARQAHKAAVATVRFDTLPRPIIDGRQTGFCKLVVDRERHTILGCHVVGERAVELAQLAATAMAAQMPVEQLALVPFSFPTYANALGRAAILAAVDLDHTGMWAADHLETALEAGVA